MGEKLRECLTEAYRSTRAYRMGLLEGGRGNTSLYSRLNDLECGLFDAVKALREEAHRAALAREEGR